jgi:hypothetical protein
VGRPLHWMVRLDFLADHSQSSLSHLFCQAVPTILSRTLLAMQPSDGPHPTFAGKETEHLDVAHGRTPQGPLFS